MLPVLEAERIYNLSQSVFLGNTPQTQESLDMQNRLFNQLERTINELDSAGQQLSEEEFKAKLLSAGISIEIIG